MNGNVIQFIYELHQDKTIGQLKLLYFGTELANNSKIKWIHQGKLMKDDAPISSFPI
jgi:hypothetical protein